MPGRLLARTVLVAVATAALLPFGIATASAEPSERAVEVLADLPDGGANLMSPKHTDVLGRKLK